MTAFVLLHGFAQTPASWDAVVQQLQAAGHRTYVLDLYESKGDLKLLSTEGALEDAEQGKGVEGDAGAEGALASARDPLASLGAVCDRVAAIVRLVAQADGAPVLVGYSMGGRIAAETVLRHPDLPLAGLVLESAGLGPADEAARVALAERNGAWAQRLREEGVAAFMDWWETPASRRCRQRRTPPFALSVSPGTRGLSLAPWKPGAPTIKLLKRLRFLSSPN